ncbi:DUF3105 domain-containing protein [Chryseoglobus sp. 28M-23]|uniref:DUF3105 domain-containing protein n=1 Tax=Chryseoglobus sp. 28M-23 TaxID=2772253 RepID=UPI001CD1739D|nr:DUF3105 domain-containing protein [Chryseoglobus sp. 28M-23]
MADGTSEDDNLTIKQQREKRRAEKVAALKKKQQTEKLRNRITVLGSIAAGAGVLSLIIAVVITSATPPVDPSTIEVEGVQEIEGLEPIHVETVVEYDQTPPAGGPHNPAWLNCGIYEEPVPNENAVHSLEHGAVWVTYDPAQLSDDEVSQLRNAMPSTYMILSPYEGLDAPVYASSWGFQVALDGVDDPRLNDFIVKYRQSPEVPEPGALCSQAVDGPGKIS